MYKKTGRSILLWNGSCIVYEQPELIRSDDLLIRPRKSIEKMLKLAAEFGL
jgi:hypothetical protein